MCPIRRWKPVRDCAACRIMDKEQRQNIVEKTGGQGMKIIICDDEPYICDDLKKRLPGMRLEICGTGQNAGLLGSAVYGFQKVKENQK